MKTPSRTQFCFHCPTLWRTTLGQVFRKAGLAKVRSADPKTALYENGEFSFALKKLDVAETGIIDTGLHTVREQDGLGSPILVLPIGHYVLNHKEFDLELLGPAFGTRNDIYLVRPRNRRPIGWNGQLNIAVKEYELTTSNALRIAILHASMDLCVEDGDWWLNTLDQTEGAASKTKGQDRSSNGSRFLMKSNFVSAGKPHDRLAHLTDAGICHVGLFLGHELIELEGRSKSAKFDAVDVFNINQVLNAIYDSVVFPRAVFAGFTPKTVEEGKSLGVAMELVNSGVQRFQDSLRRDWRWSRSIVPLHTGSATQSSDWGALRQFSVDMVAKHVKAHREQTVGADQAKIREVRKSEILDFANFAFRRQVNWLPNATSILNTALACHGAILGTPDEFKACCKRAFSAMVDGGFATYPTQRELLDDLSKNGQTQALKAGVREVYTRFEDMFSKRT